MNTMKPEIKALWIAALEGGEYKQGPGCLRYNSGVSVQHCCLGVLTELAVQAGVMKDDGHGYSLTTYKATSPAWAAAAACT
jgi:hypothetical protein